MRPPKKRVFWIHKDGRTLNGETISAESADAHADRANREYPDIQHWTESVAVAEAD